MSSPEVVHRSRDQAAHAAAVKVDTKDIVKFLSENLGPSLTSLIAGVETRTVNRWASNEGGSPRPESERKLRAAFQVFQLVQTVEAAPTVRAWFMGMNPQLDDISPAEAIAEDRVRDTMAAARAFIAGG